MSKGTLALVQIRGWHIEYHRARSAGINVDDDSQWGWWTRLTPEHRRYFSESRGKRGGSYLVALKEGDNLGGGFILDPQKKCEFCECNRVLTERFCPEHRKQLRVALRDGIPWETFKKHATASRTVV